MILFGSLALLHPAYRTSGAWGWARRSQPICDHNVYYNYGGGQERTDGNGFSDSAPIHADPQLSGWTYNIAPGSPIFDAPVNFPGIKGGWGPPGYAVPRTGTPPSSPH